MKGPQAVKQKQRTVHEAGHAVVGRVLGLTCGRATIVPDYTEMTWGYAPMLSDRSRIGRLADGGGPSQCSGRG
jgi:hypothetical protein